MPKCSVLDLFAGAGGLSLGFSQAGFNVEAAIECDAWASETYQKNHGQTRVYCLDITEEDDPFFKQFKGVDAVIGGPPCQGFSISASNRRDPKDKRNYLYKNFLNVVAIVSPKLILIENVKEFATKKDPSGEKILDTLENKLSLMGYRINGLLLNAKHFGVPQDRVRFFLLASKYKKPIVHQTHGLKNTLFNKYKPCLSLWDAISDLPEVKPRQFKEGETFTYEKLPENTYQKEMRKGSDLIKNHIPMRHTDRIIERLSKITIGTNVESIEEKHKPRKRGQIQEISGKTYSQNHRRLNPNVPGKTITASFYSSFIHPFQHRNLTVREAARIQSFPDWFEFYGLRTKLSHKLLNKKGIYHEMHLDQFNQVGNAVPPILAKVLANALLKTLEG